jgi:hypothetical protein
LTQPLCAELANPAWQRSEALVRWPGGRPGAGAGSSRSASSQPGGGPAAAKAGRVLSLKSCPKRLRQRKARRWLNRPC